MHDPRQAKLESFGLSTGEAQIYLALSRSGGTLSASALAATTRIPRTGVYPLLNSLVQKGIVEADAGYGSRFTAIRPAQALPSLIAREHDEQMAKLLQRERLAENLIEELESIAEPAANNGESEVIQVLRDPRVIGERFDRLQLEARRQIDVIVKAPILNPQGDNPAQKAARKRGVQVRGLYERAALEDPAIQPYVGGWIADGEEMRVYDGDLPHKLAIFDTSVVLLPLSMPGARLRTLFVMHQQLAQSLRVMFEFFWKQAEPLVSKDREKAKSGRGAPKSTANGYRKNPKPKDR